MKKYYIHNGTEQVGPFTIEELKVNKINKTTPIWYDGLDIWTTAEQVEELQELLKSSAPPPFGEPKKMPPPIQKPTKSFNSVQPEPKKKSKTGTIIAALVTIILLGFAAIMFVNNPDSIPGVKIEINTPKPVIATSRADNSNSDLLKKRLTVYATVMNQGGDGNVLVMFKVYQAGNTYDRTKSVYLRANESQDVTETFDEVTRLGGDITYDVQASAQ